MNLDRWWRGLGTALSFLAFGIGGLFIGLVVAPLLSVCVRDSERRQYLARCLIQRCFRAFITLMQGLGVLDYHFDRQERLQRPGLLVVANHPSLIDVIFLLAHMPHADCIVKGRLASNPFTRGPVRAAGYITNNEPEAVLKAAGESLRKGNSLILFPEGTRTTPQRPIKFRRGGANIALRTGTAITPVLIRCTPTTLTKGEPWYHIPASRVRMELRVLDDLPINDDNQQPTGQLARQLTHRLSDHFNRELEQRHHERDTRRSVD
ncbi:lysophospholipid acyltransferase family protein [Halomonas heilongjiangensis]|uniref:1-acyl-sn-glycerol-3-phosphate acyltransferase n=1 Tax=Halomonas heilongjiangensis TaxID=1387883 RepID=A0A2N7TVZ0_9GAMM|nr:lysophospholipid acyltransferase family protein [Halomonas heilongjiangensis]PMR72350.1 1-acyl-sn-glycerol-3-phosphate acyltransferase [Halomonas heilongjiangensis]PXX86878.1 1-acyl-sn-glycerol-3-phosphate acyltransferase [Halomonas heilongjiangensis]